MSVLHCHVDVSAVPKLVSFYLHLVSFLQVKLPLYFKKQGQKSDICSCFREGVNLVGC